MTLRRMLPSSIKVLYLQSLSFRVVVYPDYPALLLGQHNASAL